MHKDYQKFFRQLLLIGLPYMAILATYLWLDPFMVLYTYDTYYKQVGPERNVDFVGVETYKKNKDTYHFDSFILGNSRSQAFKTKDWQPYIGNAKPFHFSASGETLFGVYSKVKYLDESKAPIKHVLIIIDQYTLSKTTDSKGVVLIKHPEVSKKSLATFHVEFMKGYLQEFFFVKYLYYQAFKKDIPLGESIIDRKTKIHDDITNDIYYKWCDDAIAKDSVQYYAEKEKIFYPRQPNVRYSERNITVAAAKMLKEINAIFKKHDTDFKVIINPLYEQTALNKDDLSDLRAIFGANHVYDYSGVNEFTTPIHNYYESSHYRPIVAKEILEKIYRREPLYLVN